MSKNNFYTKLSSELETIKERAQYRGLIDPKYKEGSKILIDDRQFLNLSSNDYLGIATDALAHSEFLRGANLQTHSMSSSSSRSLTGNHVLYSALEDKISQIYNLRSALVFNSGYHANIGILPTITKKADLILSDKLNHASIIDGMKLSEAKFLRYRHKDMHHLEKQIEKSKGNFNNIFIISESIFSMDGDLADLRSLVEIKKRHDAILIIDEAHAVGARGDKGLGLCEEQNVINDIDIIVGTFGKALASIGAFAVTNKTVKSYLINNMRSFIFTTALPPVSLSWSLKVLNKVEALKDKRAYLREISNRLRDKIKRLGFDSSGESHIVPIVVGDNETTLKLANHLKERGILASAIRPPTVPVNSSRVRLSLSSNMTDIDIDNVIKAIEEFKK